MVMTEEKISMFTIGEVGEILGSVPEGDPEFRLTPVNGVEIDSRRVKKGDLFFAVKGDRHDGHDYIESAFENGAVAAVVSGAEASARNLRKDRLIPVVDTVFSLGELACRYRKKFDAEIIAVTGSNGKTTVKNLIYEILRAHGPTLKSEKNYNNFFGVPLSVFKIKREHRRAVFELGMSAPGEIARLGEIISPDIAVVTNVGPVHIEFFESVEKIADAKMEIHTAIRTGGTLVINGDDDLLRNRVKRDIGSVMTFGLGKDNDLFPVDLKFDDQQLSSFRIENAVISSRLPGVHNVYNILAAVSVAKILGISAESCVDPIDQFEPADMRSQIIKKRGIAFILDCYNANPVSMKYAIDTLAAMKCKGRRIAVLGDMLELGRDSIRFHEELGRYAKIRQIDLLYCTGSLGLNIAEAFGKAAVHIESRKELGEQIRRAVKGGDIVLFKASRGIALEETAYAVIGTG